MGAVGIPELPSQVTVTALPSGTAAGDLHTLLALLQSLESGGALKVDIQDLSLNVGAVDQGAAGADPWLVTGAVTVSNFPATQPISVASLPLPLGAATDAGLAAIAGLLAGPLGVVGTVGISGSVAVTGPLTDTQIRATPLPVSGTFWQATQPVSIAALPALAAGTNNIGDVDVLSLPALPAGSNAIGSVTIGAALPAGTNAIGKLAANSGVVIGAVEQSASPWGTNLTQVGGTAIVTGGVNGLPAVGGAAAHDAVYAGSPLPVGGYASAVTPTSVSADGDVVRLWLSRFGAVVGTIAGSVLSVADTGANVVRWTDPSGNAAPVWTANAIYDGAFWVKQRGDATAGAWMQGAAANGATFVGNPLPNGGYASSAIPTLVSAGQVGRQWLALSGATVVAGVVTSGGDATTVTGIQGSDGVTRLLGSALFNTNPGSWDRARNNSELGLLTSAARTTTTNSPDQTHYNGAGAAFLVLNVTANPGGGETLSIKVQGKDPTSGNYYDVADGGVLITAANGTKVFAVGPGFTAADAATGVTVKGMRLPRIWRAVVTHSASGSWTYSVSSHHWSN